ncbi:MAG: SOS response-associated peptidase, partial [Elusimicrobiota bacterium]
MKRPRTGSGPRPDMCGRYTQTADIKTLQRRFGFRAEGAAFAPRYNIAPGQTAPLVVRDEARRLALMRWGLVPSWAKDPAIGHRMINARSETIAEKPAFRKPFEKRRCLVVADGFYEWRRAGRAKVPVRFVRKDGAPFAFAGLWDRWRVPGETPLDTFTVLTTSANSLVAEVHARMPVILREDD